MRLERGGGGGGRCGSGGGRAPRSRAKESAQPLPWSFESLLPPLRQGEMGVGTGTKQYVSVSDRALLSMAACLGMEPTRDKALLWIARSALEAPLPAGWAEAEDDDGTRYFYERESGKTSWQLPSDDYYRQVLRARVRGVRVRAALGSALPPPPPPPRTALTPLSHPHPSPPPSPALREQARRDVPAHQPPHRCPRFPIGLRVPTRLWVLHPLWVEQARSHPRAPPRVVWLRQGPGVSCFDGQ